MAGGKILVFGATGPAGICLLRELLHRNLPAIAYCRSPSKLPADLTPDSLLEVSRSAMQSVFSTNTHQRCIGRQR
jgi:putative NADH-flavin reductase